MNLVSGLSRSSYKEISTKNLSCSTPDHPISQIFFNPKTLHTFLEFSIQSTISSIDKERFHSIPASITPSECLLIAKSLNEVSDDVFKTFPHPIHLSQNQLASWRSLPFLDAYYQPLSENYFLPHHLNPPAGCCYGLCTWFALLYLHTQKLFTNPTQQIHWISDQIKEGANLPATILQTLNSFYIKKGKKIGLKIGAQKEKTSTYTHIESFYIHDHITNTFIHKLNALPNGIYYVENINHTCIYLKIDPSLSYFYDPNQGITQMSGPQIKTFYYLIRNTMKNTNSDHTKDEVTLIEELIKTTHFDRDQLLKATPASENYKTLYRSALINLNTVVALFKTLIKNDSIPDPYSKNYALPTWIAAFDRFKNLSNQDTPKESLLDCIKQANNLLKQISFYYTFVVPIKLRETHNSCTDGDLHLEPT